MEIVKRNSFDDANITKISNGYVVKIRGRNSSEIWTAEEIYCVSFDDVVDTVEKFFNLELIK